MEALSGILEAVMGILANLGIDFDAISAALEPITSQISGIIGGIIG